jgi:hypothetical protein
MKLTKLFTLLLIAINLCQSSSAQQSCWCTGQTTYCIDKASDLWTLLDPANPSPPQPGETIGICGTIYLGDLSPWVFPLEIPYGVTLQGNYDFADGGTRIVFPFRYKNGHQCGSGQIVGNNPQVTSNTDSDIADNNDPDPFIMSTTNEAFVFAMQCGSRFNNICLQGPKTDYKEEFMTFQFTDACSPNVLFPHEGTVGGILARGDDVKINNSEIYGFPFYNMEVRPETPTYGNCGPGNPKGLGEVTIDQCFLHNSKANGWGYAIYNSDGGSNCYNEPLPCTTTCCNPCTPENCPKEGNQYYKSEMTHVHNTMFMENGKDIDASGNRYSLDFNNCTMGLQNEHITNQHGAFKLCNPWITSGSACNTGNPDCCTPVIRLASGESFSMTNCYFLNGGTLEFGYPNFYVPVPPCSSFVPINPLLTVMNNFFFSDYSTSPNDRITISRSEHHKWTFDHFKWYWPNPAGMPIDTHRPLNTLWVTGTAPTLSFLEINNFRLFNDVSVSGIPHVKIGVNFPNSCDRPVYDPSRDEHNIFQGDYLCFNTDACLDAHLNQSVPGNSMRYIWRFHETPFDLDDEVRTYHRSIFYGTPFTHTFSQIGITNVNLIGIDMNTHTMSYIATHSVTVKPPITDHTLHLTFDIKDTHDGPWEQNPSGQCGYDTKQIVLPPAVLPPYPTACPNGVCPGDAIANTATNFELYVKINHQIIWKQDIGKNPAGWQHIEYPKPGDLPLEEYLCTDDNYIMGSPCFLQNDNIEIGLRAIGNVDATLVRGVTVFIDNVYINCGGYKYPQGTLQYNENVLLNGDFEEYTGNLVPTHWTPYIIGNNNITSQCYYAQTGGTQWSSAHNGTPKLATYEVRSGIYSYWARIMSAYNASDHTHLPSDAIYNTNSNIVYYFSINQSFTLQNPPRLANPADSLQENISFTIKPNPSASGTTITGMFDQLPPKESYKINVLSPSGNLIYSGTGTGKYFTLNKILEPGIYYISVHSNDFTGYRKVVVVN